MQPEESKIRRGFKMRTVYLEATTAAALNALARNTGRSQEAVIREHVGVPAGPLTVHAVDLADALSEQLRAASFAGSKSWPEILEKAFTAATRVSAPTGGERRSQRNSSQ